MIKAILWDNDGVLVDTEKLFFAATRHVLATVGFSLTTELFVEFSLIKGKGLRDYMEQSGYDTSNFDALREIRNKEYSALLQKESRLIPGVKETLASLHGKYAMGIVTSSKKVHFDIIHQHTDIRHFFDFVLTRDDYKNSKPDPEPYLKGLALAGVKQEECLVIEDSARGLASANQASLFCLMIPNELSRPETYKGDYKLLNNSGEIITFLDD